jgi:hypothetical protein
LAQALGDSTDVNRQRGHFSIACEQSERGFGKGKREGHTLV